jgi:spermidine/putrescine transport system substrate-binding protein
MTGIWVNTKEAPDIKSVNDLFDPKYKGRVTFQSEMRDSVGLTLKGEGIDPAEATKDEWLAAIDKIEQAADSGQIRRFGGQDYVQDLNSGNVVAAIGWSGDSTLVDNPDAEWRMPTEGCMLWADTMVIPVGAPNTAAALEFMNFVYEPEVQADIAAWVNYVTPVEGTEEILAERDPKLAKDPRIFPDEEFTTNCTPYADPPGETEDVREVTESFEDVVSG